MQLEYWLPVVNFYMETQLAKSTFFQFSFHYYKRSHQYLKSDGNSFETYVQGNQRYQIKNIFVQKVSQKARDVSVLAYKNHQNAGMKE